MARTTKQQHGSQGKRGLTGTIGPRGPRGERGQSGPKGRRGERGESGPVHITRSEFEAALKDIAESIRTLQVQFRRMADIQAEVDVLKRSVERLSEKFQGLG